MSSKLRQIKEWADKLTEEQLRSITVELVLLAVESEQVALGDLSPYWEHTGEPLVEGQKTWKDED